MMLGMISQKMTGQILDVRDLAARIMNTPDMQWGNLGAGASGSGGGFGGNSYSAGTEAQLLKCLELIDLDDSSRMPRLDLRRSATGQTGISSVRSRGRATTSPLRSAALRRSIHERTCRGPPLRKCHKPVRSVCRLITFSIPAAAPIAARPLPGARKRQRRTAGHPKRPGR